MICNCKTVQALLVEYGDGVLDGVRRAQVGAHLETCPYCARLVQEMAAAQTLLRSLPARQTSAHFEARLTDRLAQARRPDPATPWWRTLADSLRCPPRVLRPALALGAAAVAVVGALAFHSSPPAAQPPLPAVDAALISQCVALHQRDVAAQPLSDPAMQNVAAHTSPWNGDTTPGAAVEGNL